MSYAFPIIEKLGGKMLALKALNDAGDPIQYRAVHYWHEKGQIPIQRLNALVDIAKKQGVEVELEDLRAKPAS